MIPETAVKTGGGRHEMLNEVNRAEVRANLLCWISRVLGS